jgi:predicted TPR repeat methyltransferase
MAGASTLTPRYTVSPQTKKKSQDLVSSLTSDTVSSLNVFVDVQHAMLKKIMGKYPPLLPEVLVDDTPGEPKTIVDLGCGSGSW